MPPRRSHKKSRSGCKRCKARKIKCDEVHPRCGKCVKHGVPCDYEHPEVAEALAAQAAADALAVRRTSPAPSTTSTSCRPSLPPAPSTASRMMELRLMHHWTSFTSKTLAIGATPSTENVWEWAVPNLALSGATYLTNAMLAVAALHMRSMRPDDQDLMQASHAYIASSLSQYCEALNKGIDKDNAETLFLTSSLIAFQSSATRLFHQDNEGTHAPRGGPQLIGDGSGSDYVVPISYFHSFQGVKAIVANSWRWLRTSNVVIPIINSQPVLQLDFNSDRNTSFFGHLLDGLEDELAATTQTTMNALPWHGDSQPTKDPAIGDGNDTVSTRQAYQHAVAVLNWSHKIPHKGAALAFPATVSRRFVALLEERRPRALVILACFFALLRTLDNIWWLNGVARREVLGIAGLFREGDMWYSRLQWPVRIALYESNSIPPDVWGADWAQEEKALLQQSKAAAASSASGGSGPTGVTSAGGGRNNNMMSRGPGGGGASGSNIASENQNRAIPHQLGNLQLGVGEAQAGMDGIGGVSGIGDGDQERHRNQGTGTVALGVLGGGVEGGASGSGSGGLGGNGKEASGMGGGTRSGGWFGPQTQGGVEIGPGGIPMPPMGMNESGCPTM